MDAFSLLKADHENVAALFEQLESASGKRKLDIFNQIRTELELHAHIEEKIFYPALEEPEETHELTLEAYQEHDQVKKLLRELGRAKTPNEDWEAKAKVLQENVEHHVDEEENELFPKAQQALSEEELAEIGELLQAEKSRKQQSARGRTSASKSSARASGARKTASKKSGSKKSGAKKGGSKKGAKKSSKKSGSKGSKKSGSKGSRKSGSKKGSKKSGSKKGRR